MEDEELYDEDEYEDDESDDSGDEYDDSESVYAYDDGGDGASVDDGSEYDYQFENGPQDVISPEPGDEYDFHIVGEGEGVDDDIYSPFNALGRGGDDRLAYRAPLGASSDVDFNDIDLGNGPSEPSAPEGGHATPLIGPRNPVWQTLYPGAENWLPSSPADLRPPDIITSDPRVQAAGRGLEDAAAGAREMEINAHRASAQALSDLPTAAQHAGQEAITGVRRAGSAALDLIGVPPDAGWRTPREQLQYPPPPTYTRRDWGDNAPAPSSPAAGPVLGPPQTIDAYTPPSAPSIRPPEIEQIDNPLGAPTAFPPQRGAEAPAVRPPVEGGGYGEPEGAFSEVHAPIVPPSRSLTTPPPPAVRPPTPVSVPNINEIDNPRGAPSVPRGTFVPDTSQIDNPRGMPSYQVGSTAIVPAQGQPGVVLEVVQTQTGPSPNRFMALPVAPDGHQSVDVSRIPGVVDWRHKDGQLEVLDGGGRVIQSWPLQPNATDGKPTPLSDQARDDSRKERKPTPQSEQARDDWRQDRAPSNRRKDEDEVEKRRNKPLDSDITIDQSDLFYGQRDN